MSVLPRGAWLCEEHPTLPWEHEGCGGAGVACVCNPNREVLWVETFVESESNSDTNARVTS